jgi:hypothetical protein
VSCGGMYMAKDIAFKNCYLGFGRYFIPRMSATMASTIPRSDSIHIHWTHVDRNLLRVVGFSVLCFRLQFRLVVDSTNKISSTVFIKSNQQQVINQ